MVFIFTKFGRGLITKYLLHKYAIFFKGFSTTLFLFFRKHYMFILLNLLVSFLKWTILAYLYYLLIILFGGEVGFYPVFLITSMSVLVSLVPISLSGLGIRESLAIYLYGLLGVDTAVIMAIQVIYLIFSYLFAAMAVFMHKK